MSNNSRAFFIVVDILVVNICYGVIVGVECMFTTKLINISKKSKHFSKKIALFWTYKTNKVCVVIVECECLFAGTEEGVCPRGSRAHCSQ